MKYLKAKYILTYSLIFILGISLLIFFFGGLRAASLENDNEEFDLTGYVDYYGFNENGEKTVTYGSQQELDAAVAGLDPSTYTKTIDAVKGTYSVKYKLSTSKIVAQNQYYTMFLNEITTVVSVAKNSSCNAPTGKTFDGLYDKYDVNTCKTVYASAIGSSMDAEQKSNLILDYIGSNGKLTSLPYNTYKYSVQYENLLKGGIKERFYQINFDQENGIDILYKIGDFTVINSYFPSSFRRSDMEEIFRGNLVFGLDAKKITSSKQIVYTKAYTWSAECAAYLENKGLATVSTEADPTTKLKTDENGNTIPALYTLNDILATDDLGRPLNKTKMVAGVDYNATDFNAEGASPCVANPFLNFYTLDYMFKDLYSLIRQSKDEKNPEKYDFEWKYDSANASPTFELKAKSSLDLMTLYDYMYKADTPESRNYFYTDFTGTVIVDDSNIELFPGHKKGDTVSGVKVPIIYDENPYDDVAGKPFIMGGFQARDELGNFLYDEDGKPVQEVFTQDMANIQNSIFGIQVESNAPIFQVGLRFTLTDLGLETVILNNSLREGLGTGYRDEDGKRTEYSHNCLLGDIKVLPYMTANNSTTSEGEIIVPDGSGAIISFNSPKDALGYNAFDKPIYGPDKAFSFRQAPQTAVNENFMFGMFGFLDKTEKKGVLAIADKGANQNYIYANFKRTGISSSMNQAYFRAIFREQEKIYIGPYNTEFQKWSKDFAKTDFKYIYQFLNESQFIAGDGSIQYVTLAGLYRTYLMDKYQIEPDDNTTENVVNLNFLGAIEKRQVAFGFARNVDLSLTTFDQAEQIIRELQDQGVTNFNAAYTSWTEDAMEPKATSGFKVSRVLGNRKGLIDFNEFLTDNAINFYPDIRVTTNKGYDFAFGDLKYTSKSIGSSYATHNEYALATSMADTTIKPISMLSPKFYNSLVSKQMKSYRGLQINGAYFSDLGNTRVGDYSRDDEFYSEDGMRYQLQALETASKTVDKIMLSSPFDYAFGYADFAVNVPMESTLIGYYDYTIPFYQLVISGLFDYSGQAVNNDSEHSVNWYLLKSLETGSNLSFVISYEDTKTLLDTDYTMYFNAYFANWKSEIIRMNNIINATKIHHGVLQDHKILRDNVYQVEYSNGTKLIVNYNNTVYYDTARGISVRPNWFAVLEEGI